MTAKAQHDDFLGRFREIVSDPLNLLIERVPNAGFVEDGRVYIHNGNRVPIGGAQSYYGSFSNILIINRGVHEPLEEFVFQELLPHLDAAPLMLELGAYWGHYSMWLKLKRPESQVYLVEPIERNLEAGRANFGFNGFEGEFICAYVGRGHFQVDQFVEDRALEMIDILHVDIQGYEYEMLDGAAKTIADRKVNYILISTHSQKLHGLIRSSLADSGYRVEVDSDVNHETTSDDGFLFASSPAKPPVFSQFRTLGREEICSSNARALVKYLADLAGTEGQ